MHTVCTFWVITSSQQDEANSQRSGPLLLLSSLVGTDEWIKFFIRLLYSFILLFYACSGLFSSGWRQGNIIWLLLLQEIVQNRAATKIIGYLLQHLHVCRCHVIQANLHISERTQTTYTCLHVCIFACVRPHNEKEQSFWAVRYSWRVDTVTVMSYMLRTNVWLEPLNWNWVAAH